MKDTRLEIFSNNVWKSLVLGNNSLSYNKVVNRIGEYSNRQISHSNTFSLPLIHENIQALGINVFNHYSLSAALNTRYFCKYYVDNKIFERGYLIINNTSFDEIRVNFIQTSLDLIEIWSNTNFKEMVISPEFIKPVDYQVAIDELRSYELSKSLPVSVYLGEVGTRGYNFGLFPNNLNAIGDSFQINEDGIRPDNSFNPYHSRPVFNMKSIFDLCTETFGYTPIYDDSVDWEQIEKYYMVSEGLNESSDEDTSQITYASNNPQSPNIASSTLYYDQSGVTWFVVTGNESGRFIKPDNISAWEDPVFITGPFPSSAAYKGLDSVFVPDLENSPYGSINLSISSPNNTNGTPRILAEYVWIKEDGTDFISAGMSPEREDFNGGVATASFKKDYITAANNSPAFDGYVFIGIMFLYSEWEDLTATTVSNITITETFLNLDTISFDDNGEYISEKIDLSFGLPDKKIKDLLKGIMNQQGILLDINEVNKTVKFFNYSIYTKNRDNGNFSNWSKYLRKYTPFIYNTDYGNEYAKINNIGLQDPFSGNSFNLRLNQSLTGESKYKDFTNNHSKIFKDVSNIRKIDNSASPYVEYTNLGLGIIERVDDLGDLTQVNYNAVNIGTISNLPALANVNYFKLPLGVQSWYRLIDESVRANPTFLLPSEVVKNVDLSEPIYIEEMNGFWIIEEIAEYKNAQTAVIVKLMRVVEDAEFNNDFNEDFKI